MAADVEHPSRGPVKAGTAAGTALDLGRLAEAVRDRGPDGRREVARTVGEVYLDGRLGLSARERAMVLDILGRVLRDAETALRRALAERLAEDPDVPRDLIMALAEDEIEVARPVLLLSARLDEADLVALVRRHATAHQLAIAARRVVTAPVGDALVDAGDATVAGVLLRNPGASLSPRALSLLADAAQRCAALGEPLLERPELTPDLAARLYWVVSLELRRSVLRRFAIPRDQLDRALQATVQRLLDGTRRRIGAEHEALADRLGEAGSITPAVLLQVLRVGRFELFALLLGRLAALPTEVVSRMLAEHGGESLAVACRAVGVEKGHFASIFLLARGARPGDQRVDPRELSRVLSFFDRLPPEQATARLAAWRAGAQDRARPDA